MLPLRPGIHARPWGRCTKGLILPYSRCAKPCTLPTEVGRSGAAGYAGMDLFVRERADEVDT
jgi:hypothetical protein